MASPRKTALLTTVLLGALAVGGVAGFVYSGSYNIAADAPHSTLVYSALETMRDRSIRAHAAGLVPPAGLDDQTRIVQGAGNYAAMCAGCHLAPGVKSSELSAGLYPSPPNLTRTSTDVAEAFWVIKHGIKASGMPAWGKSMDDGSIWNLAAFLKVLPTLDDAAYDQMVASSGGHSHGGDQAQGDHHAGADSAPHAEAAAHHADKPSTADAPMAGHHDKPLPASAMPRAHNNADGHHNKPKPKP